MTKSELREHVESYIIKIPTYAPMLLGFVGLGSYCVYLFASDRQVEASGVLVYVVMMFVALCIYHLVFGLMDRVRSIENTLHRYEIRELEAIARKPLPRWKSVTKEEFEKAVEEQELKNKEAEVALKDLIEGLKH